MTITPKKFQIFIAIFFTIIFLFYLGWEVRAFIKAPDLEIIAADIEGDYLLVRGRTSGQSRVFINGQEVLVNEQGLFSESILLPDGQNVLNFRAISRLGKETNAQTIIHR